MLVQWWCSVLSKMQNNANTFIRIWFKICWYPKVISLDLFPVSKTEYTNLSQCLSPMTSRRIYRLKIASDRTPHRRTDIAVTSSRTKLHFYQDIPRMVWVSWSTDSYYSFRSRIVLPIQVAPFYITIKTDSSR